MKHRTRMFAGTLAAAGMTLALGGTAAANDNSMYGETRINQLPAKGKTARSLWVGSWFSYNNNGIAYRHKRSFPECAGVSATADPAELVEQGKTFCLSPAGKVDYLAGRLDKVEWAQIAEYQRIAQEELHERQTQLRVLVRRVNAWIEANPGQNWRETEDGAEYLRISEHLETARQALPAITIDTATEFEHIHHGKGVPGVESWWGHCNAWAAAALVEDEPKRRGLVTVGDRSVEFTPGEAKALITEAWMEHHSSFFGSRHNDPDKNEGPAYDDITPAAFHIYFGTQLGLRQKGFVIDRYTGSEV